MAKRTYQGGSDAPVISDKESADKFGLIGVTKDFANLNHVIVREVAEGNKSRFLKHDKNEISGYLSDPEKNEKEIREVMQYIYNASSHFKRLIQYFVSLSDLAYIVEPNNIDPSKIKASTIRSNYRKTLAALSSMHIKTQVPKILTVCFREDVFYATLWTTADDITIQQLPSNYCRVSSIEGNVMNVEFDFTYFDNNEELLDSFPAEFRSKYNMVSSKKQSKSGRGRTSRGTSRSKWVELDSPTSFAIKVNSDNVLYPVPPFVGLLREIYDIEDYKDLKLSKTAIDNYAMIAMKLPLDDDGGYVLDFPKAEQFWRNLDSILPEEIGSILTPMEMSKIGFDNPRMGTSDTIAEAEQNLFTAAGVSSLLFNNEKASSNALLLSIKADQAITYGVVKQIGDAINRYLQHQSYGKYFSINFLDVSPWNRKEVGDAYLKSASYGLPTISMYAASQGLSQEKLDSMSFLEGEVLQLQKMFKPIVSSTQMSGKESLEGKGATDEGGAPKKDVGEITESGEQNQEDA